MEIREFIEARLKDDQAAIDRAARFRYDHPSDSPWERSRLAIANGAALSSDPLIALHNPAREAREVAAKRAILDAAEEASVLDIQVEQEFGTGGRTEPYVGDVILRALASVWIDHPDFDPAWRING